MAGTKAPNSEIQQLKDRIAALENQLKEAKANRAKNQSDASDDREILTRLMDESEKITQGLVASGLETLAVAADITRNFADRASQLSRGGNGEAATKQLTHLPMEMGEAMLGAVGESVDGAQRVIDKFRANYRNN